MTRSFQHATRSKRLRRVSTSFYPAKLISAAFEIARKRARKFDYNTHTQKRVQSLRPLLTRRFNKFQRVRASFNELQRASTCRSRRKRALSEPKLCTHLRSSSHIPLSFFLLPSSSLAQEISPFRNTSTSRIYSHETPGRNRKTVCFLISFSLSSRLSLSRGGELSSRTGRDTHTAHRSLSRTALLLFFFFLSFFATSSCTQSSTIAGLANSGVATAFR